MTFQTRSQTFPDSEMTSLVNQLSDRGLEIFRLVGDGYAAHEIAERLHLSINTVAAHRENIKKKLNLKSSEELARYAILWLRHRESVAGAVGEIQPAPSVRSSKRTQRSKSRRK